MNILIFAFIFLLGTIIGSFLNVVIYRFNTGRTIVRGRSVCMTCNRNLRWYELIPLFSYLFQLGKCRRCAEKISHQYPIVEFITGVVFMLIAQHFLPALFFTPVIYVSLVVLYVFIFSHAAKRNYKSVIGDRKCLNSYMFSIFCRSALKAWRKSADEARWHGAL